MDNLNKVMGKAMREHDRHNEWLRQTPLVVHDLQSTSSGKGKWAKHRRYRLMWQGYLHPSVTKSRPNTVYDTLRGWDGVGVNNYRKPDASTLAEIEALDEQISALQTQRGLLLADRFLTWPLVTLAEVKEIAATDPDHQS